MKRNHIKILYIVTEDWVMCSHFLPMLQEARKAGFEVLVATRVKNHRSILEREGARVIHIDTARNQLNPNEIIRYMWSLYKLLRNENPQIIQCISLRVIMLAGLVQAVSGKRKIIHAVIGLGHLWISDEFHIVIIRLIVRFLILKLFRNPETIFIFENHDDPAVLGFTPLSSDLVIMPGAGVDENCFFMQSEPETSLIKVAIVARITYAKGIKEAIEAVLRARDLGANVELNIFGAIDPLDKGCMPKEEILELCRSSGSIWHGKVDDIPKIWRSHHIGMLLSYREGLPKCLVESLASGRPVIASDVAGCREVVRNNIEGFLVPLGDIEAAAQALFKLCTNSMLRKKLGLNARNRFLSNFTETIVREKIGKIYFDLSS